jgi:hypothetical protein
VFRALTATISPIIDGTPPAFMIFPLLFQEKGQGDEVYSHFPQL